MANPQRENGYTAIANELLEVFIFTKFSDYQRRVILAIWRKTYGFNKKEDWIANSQFVSLTGMNKGNVSRALNELVTGKVVIRRDNKVSVNKDWEEWRVIRRDNKSYPTGYQKLSPQQPQKQKAKNNILAKAKNMKTYNEEMGFEENTQYDEDGPISVPKKKSKGDPKRISAENLLKFYNAKYKLLVGDDIPYYPKSAYLKQVYPVLEKYPEDKLEKLMVDYLKAKDEYIKQSNWAIWTFLSWKVLNRLNK